MKIQKTIALSTAALALSASLLTVPAFAVEGTLAEYPNCPHLQGHHDAECGYVEAQDEVPCSNKNHDWLSPSSHDCTYKPAVKGVPCAHVHTADCLPKNNVVDPDEDGSASAYIEPNYYADYDEDVTFCARRLHRDLPRAERPRYRFHRKGPHRHPAPRRDRKGARLRGQLGQDFL